MRPVFGFNREFKMEPNHSTNPFLHKVEYHNSSQREEFKSADLKAKEFHFEKDFKEEAVNFNNFTIFNSDKKIKNSKIPNSNFSRPFFAIPQLNTIMTREFQQESVKESESKPVIVIQTTHNINREFIGSVKESEQKLNIPSE